MDEPQTVLAKALIGTWWLIDRIDRAADGGVRPEPTLGSDPLAMVTYTGERFAAQFMRRDRATSTSTSAPAASGTLVNNTSAVDGYDAYFGTYRIGDNGLVRHKLDAAITRANIGMEVERRLSVEGDQLTIVLETKTAGGEPVTRTLRWKRIG